MNREVRWERMFVDELEAAFEECPVLYLPYGLCEPHGPQNTLGCDALRAHGAVCRAARRFGGIVAPPEYWHIHELGGYGAWAYERIGEVRPWLSTLPPWMFFKNVCYHVRAADALGFHATILFTGHAGPHSHDLSTVVDALQTHVRTRLAFLTDHDVAPERFRNRFGHAGATETAYLWAAEPDCVDLSRIPALDEGGPHFAMGDDARHASRRDGEELLDGIAEALGERAAGLCEEYDRLATDEAPHEPLTFAGVEEIWHRDILPRMKGFACMRQLRDDKEPPPPESRWYAQWRIGEPA